MFNDRNQKRCLRILVRAAVAVCGLVFLASGQLALAQSFTWDKVDPAYAKGTAVSAAKGLKTQVVMGGMRLSSNRQAFENWYRKYLFPAMASREFLEDMYDNRDSLLKDLERSVDPAARQVLLDLAYTESVKRATGKYHPAVRYNALLIIGNLNQTEIRRSERLPPIRLPKAFDFLVTELQKPDQLDVLRLAAMVGIQRHLRLVGQRPQEQPIPDAKKAEVAGIMKKLAEQKVVPDGREEIAHTWLRRRAIDVLATIGQVGDGQAIFNTMVGIVTDDEEPLALRCTAARAIGDLNYAGVAGIDPVATSQSLGELVAFACRNEDAWVKEHQKKLEEADSAKPNTAYGGMGGGMPGMGGGMPGMGGGMPGMGGGMPGMGGGMPGMGGGMEGGMPGMEGGYGGGYGMPGAGGTAAGVTTESDELQRLMEDARRRLKLPIYFGQLGIRGKMKKRYGAAGSSQPALGSVAQLAVDDTQKAEIQKILTALDELIAATDLVDGGLDEMMTQVRAKTRDLETVLPKPVAAPENAAGADALPGTDLPGGGAAPAVPATPAKKK